MGNRSIFMIRKLLIANRGEIAVRIIRTCREMGITTVVVFSDADKDSLAVSLADEAVAIGGNTPAESYLVIEKILHAAALTNADAIHPGFGFLAENAEFAYQVKSHGLIFVGPAPASIEAMGDKRIAKMMLSDVPFIPGYIGDDQSDEALVNAAKEVGYPIMVKAAAGGGGKGMRLVYEEKDLVDALASARRESAQAFSNDTLMLERAILEPRHIEIQVFGDQVGNIIAIGERECSIQRRHQKIVEETPSRALTPALRQRMCDTAVNIARQIGYMSAGTMEFLLDKDGSYYFMEMNTRLQVEHPVTEMVYNIDLVKWQLQVADGMTLDDIIGNRGMEPRGHAIEVRVYAEDPANQFLPVIGTIQHFEPAHNVRTDAGIRSGDTISPYYDPMIAKVIAHASNRLESIRKLEYALGQMKLLGLTNNIAYLRRILLTPEHLVGLISTRFVEEHSNLLSVDVPLPSAALIAAALAQGNPQKAWRNFPNRPTKHTFTYQGQSHPVSITATAGMLLVTVGGDHLVELHSATLPDIVFSVNGHRQKATVVQTPDDKVWVHLHGDTFALQLVNPMPVPSETQESAGLLHAPMPGKVIKVAVAAGDVVERGTLLMILEAMKMEHRIEAPFSGIVEAIHYEQGDTVQADEVLLALIESP
jgi:geranyl-CoA carboxylase alpha subunit